MNRIIVFFFVGQGSDRARCRLILGEPVEVLKNDRLGDPAWTSVAPRGLPATELLLARALRLVMDGLSELNTPENPRVWPAGVTLTNRGFEVELGDIR